jgi:hypothetical protein
MNDNIKNLTYTQIKNKKRERQGNCQMWNLVVLAFVETKWRERNTTTSNTSINHHHAIDTKKPTKDGWNKTHNN